MIPSNRATTLLQPGPCTNHVAVDPQRTLGSHGSRNLVRHRHVQLCLESRHGGRPEKGQSDGDLLLFRR